jgi:hypothetical protein
MTINTRYGRTGGPVTWTTERRRPRFADFQGHWPIISVRLVDQKHRGGFQTSLQVRKSSWHAHLPARRLGIPKRFRITAAASQTCRRPDGDAYIFDFTGMMPLPVDNTRRRLMVLLDEIDNFQRHHPELLADLGIEIRVVFRDDGEDLETDENARRPCNAMHRDAGRSR